MVSSEHTEEKRWYLHFFSSCLLFALVVMGCGGGDFASGPDATVGGAGTTTTDLQVRVDFPPSPKVLGQFLAIDRVELDLFPADSDTVLFNLGIDRQSGQSSYLTTIPGIVPGDYKMRAKGLDSSGNELIQLNESFSILGSQVTRVVFDFSSGGSTSSSTSTTSSGTTSGITSGTTSGTTSGSTSGVTSGATSGTGTSGTTSGTTSGSTSGGTSGGSSSSGNGFFVLNSATQPDVDCGAAGDFAVVYRLAGPQILQAQRWDAGDFTVPPLNSAPVIIASTNNPADANIGMENAGEFAIAWRELSTGNVLMNLRNTADASVAGPLQVTSGQVPDVDMADTDPGNDPERPTMFVTRIGGNSGHAQRLENNLIGGSSLQTVSSVRSQASCSVYPNGSGAIVIWEADPGNFDVDLRFARFDFMGNLLDPAAGLLASSVTSGSIINSDNRPAAMVDTFADGTAVMVFQVDDELRATLITSAGATTEFLLANTNVGFNPDVAVQESEDAFVVAYQDPLSGGVKVQRFSRFTGALLAETTFGTVANHISIASNPNGDYVVVYEGASGVEGRTFQANDPPEA